MRMRYVLIVSSLLLISAVAAVLIELGTRGSTAISYTHTPIIGGHAAPEVTFERLVTNSDLVVLGEVTSKQIGTERCCEAFDSRLLPTMPEPVRRVDTLVIEVTESLRGNGPSEITIKTQRPGGNVQRSGDDELALLEFDVGQTYVFFLVEREGHYKFQGVSKGRWPVDEGTVTQTGTGVTYDKATLREELASYNQ